MADTQPDTQPRSAAQTTSHRIIGGIVLVLAGILSLPVAAAFLDDQGNENWIIPAQLAGMAVIGGVVGTVLPGIAGPTASRGRAQVVGALLGVAMAVLGMLIFFLLLSGFDGA